MLKNVVLLTVLGCVSLGLAAPVAGDDLDPLTKARLSAVEGDHETCARLSDQARRMPDASWHAHHVFATCEVFDADAKRDEIGDEAWVKRINRAIDAFGFLLSSPGLLVRQEQRSSVQLIVDELTERIARAEAAGTK